MNIIDDKGKVLIKSKDIPKNFRAGTKVQETRTYTLLIRFVFNLKRLLSKKWVSEFNSSAAAVPAIAFFREENQYNPEIEKQVYKYLKEQGFEFEVSENYDPIPTKYVVNKDIYNLDNDVVINSGDTIDYNEDIQTIMKYDVFKYQDVYLTTEDLKLN